MWYNMKYSTSLHERLNSSARYWVWSYLSRIHLPNSPPARGAGHPSVPHTPLFLRTFFFLDIDFTPDLHEIYWYTKIKEKDCQKFASDDLLMATSTSSDNSLRLNIIQKYQEEAVMI